MEKSKELSLTELSRLIGSELPHVMAMFDHSDEEFIDGIFLHPKFIKLLKESVEIGTDYVNILNKKRITSLLPTIDEETREIIASHYGLVLFLLGTIRRYKTSYQQLEKKYWDNWFKEVRKDMLN